MKHKVRLHSWVSGILRAREYFFETFEIALEFVNSRTAHSAKIYNEDGELVHHKQHFGHDSYA